MNRQKYFLPILFLVLITLFACSEAQKKDNFNLTAEELITAMKSDSDMIILESLNIRKKNIQGRVAYILLFFSEQTDTTAPYFLGSKMIPISLIISA